MGARAKRVCVSLGLCLSLALLPGSVFMAYASIALRSVFGSGASSDFVVEAFFIAIPIALLVTFVELLRQSAKDWPTVISITAGGALGIGLWVLS
jgi:hypothetical protein